MVKDYDVLVAGAGPAGSAAACVLAGRGWRVGLIDRAAHPRHKLCGGLLTGKSMDALALLFGLSEADLAARGGMFHACAEYLFLHQGQELLRGAAAEPFRFIDRPAFDALLASVAVARGAKLLPGREVTACDAQAGTLRFRDGEELSARFVIGADGANAVTRRALIAAGQADRAAWKADLAAAIEVELPVGAGPGQFPREVRVPELHVGGPSVPGAGYGWVFPGPRGPKVGICGLRRHDRDFGAIFLDYLRLLGVAQPESVPLRGHPLPYGNALARPALGRLLLAGDAGGFVEPLFGEGLFYSMATGAHAATAVCRALALGADAGREYALLLDRTVRPELLWSNRLRWLLFAALRHFGPAPIKGFVHSAPAALAQMVHGRRSFKLLLPKRWEWGEEAG
ncbi:MAG TPA: geranylgeranyl reductase family protein [Humidesulfovibrio sp.]|uniref:NAD(P)/FAD-dependent oxidoreductase n=1 Tax=Humidesulfovibrio sp. TaxID=2910988 RepID=UPI002BF2CB73|nr:geranylgeranyl reductase family protein [Humidesulfovibrio sp.]HWR04062.1 geranylgeranyl reductase family protein [Humidesulfovibrio sp.]